MSGIALWVLGTLVKGTLLLVLALLVAAALRHASAALRHLVWGTGLAMLLVLPLASVLPWRPPRGAARYCARSDGMAAAVARGRRPARPRAAAPARHERPVADAVCVWRDTAGDRAARRRDGVGRQAAAGGAVPRARPPVALRS